MLGVGTRHTGAVAAATVALLAASACAGSPGERPSGAVRPQSVTASGTAAPTAPPASAVAPSAPATAGTSSPGPSSRTPAAATTSTTPGSGGGAGGGRSFTLVGVGDVLAHKAVNDVARANAGGTGYDYDPMFAPVRAAIADADLAVCNMETPIAATNTRLTAGGAAVFNSPRQLATAVREAGFDACSFASNHTWDRGARGVRETLDVLDAAGVRHAGAARSAAEMAAPPIYEVAGVKVGHLGYTYTIANDGSPTTWVPDSMPWLRQMLWPAVGAAGIEKAARALRARGAEVVVASVHWGQEYQMEPTSDQRRIAGQVLRSGAVDLVLGHHAHVVQPCERVDGRYVAYGMGNFLSNQSPQQGPGFPAGTQDGVITRFTFTEQAGGGFRVTSATYTPTLVVRPGRVVTPATSGRYADSHRRTVRAMSALGTGACDMRPAG
jgi:poly-gamma-glutamate synthesis protein (capsule biosynthesis protein)